MGPFLDLLETHIAIAQSPLAIPSTKALDFLDLQRLIIGCRYPCRVDEMVIVIPLGIIFPLKARHPAIVSQFVIQVSQGDVVAALVTGVIDTLGVHRVQHIHRLMIHTRLGALVG